MVHEYITGDKVQLKLGGPTMEITKYESELHLGVGNVYRDHNVECIWYENGEMKKDIFDQRMLVKLDMHK